MKLLLMILCCPLLTLAQSGRQDDSLRNVSDTMHFPKPFIFETSGSTTLSREVIFKNSYNWAAAIQDSLKGIVIIKDTLRKRIIARNVPATADISFTIVIQVKEAKYVCTLQDYIFHTANSKSLPVEKAARLKDYKTTANIERVIIMRNHQEIFNSLSKSLEKPDK